MTEADWLRGPGILILGLGNSLMGDDGVGVHAVRRLQADGLGGALAVECGTAVLHCEYLIERARFILAIDAMLGGKAPGTLYELTPEHVQHGPVKQSLHEITFLSILERLPEPKPEVRILAVEPERMDWDTELSPPVAAAVPAVLAEARRIAGEWLAR